MKQLKKIKLNKVVKSEMRKSELKKIIGGACTNYSCQCGEGQSSSYVDGVLDGRAECGYLP